MGTPSITDWMSSVGTLITALVAVPAAVYAAVYTRRAADAAAKAATEAANQVEELRALREPKALLMLRVPAQLTGEHQINYGRGNAQFRSGTPVYLDVWNVGGPTIMVMEVALEVNGARGGEGLESDNLTPQLLIESGKVVSINVAYQLMFRVSSGANDRLINFPNGTTATARFTVKCFSVDGERVLETDCNFRFCVTEDQIFTFTNGGRLDSATGANYSLPSNSAI